MDYRRIYNQLITRGQIRQEGLNRKLLVKKIGYVERHHILPRSMNGTNDSANLVYLTPEEHYLAHGLLVQIYPNEVCMLRALMILSGRDKRNTRNNKLYGWARRRYSEMRMGNVPWNKGITTGVDPWNKGIETPAEVCAKQSERKKRKVSIDGIIYNSLADAAEACGFENYNRVTGRCNSEKYPLWFFVDGATLKRKLKIGTPKGPMSKEAKQKMSDSKKEMDTTAWNKGQKSTEKKIYAKELCPHCNTLIGINCIKAHMNKTHKMPVAAEATV